MNFSWKAHARLWIALLVIAGIIVALATFVDVTQVIRILGRTNWSRLLPAILALVLGYALLATIWRYLLLNRPSWFSGFHATNLGNLINILSPIPAFPIRIVAMSTDPAVSLPMATSSELVVRLLDIAMRGAVVVITILVTTRVEIAPLSVISGFLLLVAALLLLFWSIRRKDRFIRWGATWLARLPRVSDQLAHSIMVDLMQGLEGAGSPARLLQAAGMMIAAWLFFFAFHLLAVLALDIPIPWQDMLVMALFSLAIAPPSAPAMPGVFHAGVAAGLAILAGYDTEMIVAYAVLLHAAELAVLAVLGLWGLIKVELTVEELLSSSDRVIEYEEAVGSAPEAVESAAGLLEGGPSLTQSLHDERARERQHEG